MPKNPISATDVKIHQAKKELGETLYYKILGGMGVEHMNELSDVDKEVFLKKLQDELKEKSRK